MGRDPPHVGPVAGEDSMGSRSGRENGGQVRVRHRHPECRHDLSGSVGGVAVEGSVVDPGAVDGGGPPVTAVPPGLDPDGRGDDQADRARPSEIAGRRDLHAGEDPTVLAVGHVNECLDGFVVEDDGAGRFHAAAARPAA